MHLVHVTIATELLPEEEVIPGSLHDMHANGTKKRKDHECTCVASPFCKVCNP